MKLGEYESHPFADVFPMLDDTAHHALVEDIRAHGLNEPIELYGGKVLDGRNRLKACIEAGVTPRFERDKRANDREALAYVVSANLHRRHLNESQRAMVAARIATLRHGGDRRSDQAANLPVETQHEAADMLSVGDRSVRSARKVQEHAAPEVAALVDAGKLAVSAAAQLVGRPVEEQREIAARVQSGQSKNARAAVNAVEKERARREAEEAERQRIEAAQVRAAAGAEEAERERLRAEAAQRWQLVEGDAVEAVAQLEDRSVHLVLTDPPYGVEVHSTRGHGARGSKDYEDGDGAFDLLAAVLDALRPKLVDDAHVLVFAGYDRRLADRTREVLGRWWNVCPYDLIWRKDNHTMRGERWPWPPPNYEIIVAAELGERTGRRLMGEPFMRAVEDCPRERNHPHTARKPVDLLERYVRNLARPGHLVVDPFAGSGSTGAAALRAGCRFWGAEVDPGNAALAKGELSRAQEGITLDTEAAE